MAEAFTSARPRADRVRHWAPWGVLGVVGIALVVAWTVLPPVIFKSAARDLWAVYVDKATTEQAQELAEGATYAEATRLMGEPLYTERALLSKDSSGEIRAVAAIAVWGAEDEGTRALFIDDHVVDARTGRWPAAEQ
jgi:hypothetical protein